MQFIEPREVTIRTSNFEMQGEISGTKDGFHFESSNTHFTYWFKEGKIDSLQLNKKNLKPEQLEIVEQCDKKMAELLG